MFTPIDLDNLTVAIREPAPGEVGFAPSGKLSGQLGSGINEADWSHHMRAGNEEVVALKGSNGKIQFFDTIEKAREAVEEHGGKPHKTQHGYIVVKMMKIPNAEDIKKSGSFRSGEYYIPAKKKDVEVGAPLNADKKARKVGQRKKPTDKQY